jgi:hypothetical protein
MPEDVGLIPKGYGKEKVGFKTIFSKIGILLVGLLVLSLIIYGGLFYYNKSLTEKLSELQTQTEEINRQRDTEFEEKVISLEAALNSLSKILKNHVYWSNVFSKFESLALPQVSFSNFNAGLENDGSVKLTLSGNTSGYTYLAKQMVSFSQDELVSNIELSGINLGTEGGIGFGLNVTFLRDILLK